MKSKVLKKAFAVVLMAAPLVLGCHAMAQAGEEIQLRKVYLTAQKDESGKSQFNEVYKKDGIIYRLKSVETQIVDELPPGEIITYDSPPFVGELEEKFKPEESVRRQEKVYKLLTSELEEVMTEEEQKYSEAPILYKGIEYIDTLPETAMVKVTNSELKQEMTVELPAVAYKELGTYWDYDFTFPLTVTECDADTYMLGQIEIPGNTPLIDYAAQFLDYLNLPSDYYEISTIEWTGQPFPKGGKLIREAEAYGRKLVKDIEATYGGEVTYPSVSAKQYHCVYIDSEAENQTDQIVYRKEATAVYEPENKKMNLWDFLKWLFLWLLSHPGTLALLILLLLLVVLLLILKGKRKKSGKEKNEASSKEEEEEHEKN